MKKLIVCFIAFCTLLCGTAFANDNYSIVDMAEFSDVDNFSEGLCAVQDSNTKRWGFVDVNKNWVIAPQYKSARHFKNGVCTVNTVDGETVLINRNGETVYKLSEFHARIDYESEICFLEKHGQYKIILEDMKKNAIHYYVSLVDDNYKSIMPSDVRLCTFIQNTNQSPEGSRTVFWENTQKKVYNYKGIDISEKLSAENIRLSDEIIANNKYIVGQTDGKIKCFDINGNKIAEFGNGAFASVLLTGNIIVSNDKVYNITENKVIFEADNIDVEAIKVYYNKYFTVKKNNGTTALYSINGKALVDFGKWDNIYPSSISDKIVVRSQKYGVADYDGNLLLPLEYSCQFSAFGNDGKYAMLNKDNNTVYIDMSTLKHHYGSNIFVNGYKYHINSESIIDSNLDVVYVCGENEGIYGTGYGGGFVNEGRVKLYHNNPRRYSFLIFDDGGIKVELDNNRLEFDVLPVVVNERTLVPMRAIFEALGAEVEWNGETQAITATSKDVTVNMQIGNNTLTKNGQTSEIDVCPQIIDGRTMVPVRAISDCFNVVVDWNGYSQTVSLFTN